MLKPSFGGREVDFSIFMLYCKYEVLINCFWGFSYMGNLYI